MMRSVFLFVFAIFAVVTATAIPRDDGVGIVPSRSRMLLYFTRNLTMTFQEFSDYWRGPHARLFLNTTVAKQNLLRYEQLHVNQEWKQKLRDEGLSVPEYDGVMIAEAETLDKVIEVFNNPEYNEIVIPDSVKFTNFSTAVFGGFKITTVFDKLSKNLPDSQLGIIRKDVQTLVGDFTHKEGMEYSDFVKYWSQVDTPQFLDVIHTTGADKVFSKYELNTLDPIRPTIEVPFTSFTDQWDAVAMLNGPTLNKVVNELKDHRILDYVHKDAPNFVNVNKGIDFVPCDVVSFKIPKA